MEERTLGLQARLEESHWWYAARRRIVRELLGPVAAGTRVLDAGCGPGGNRAILPAREWVVALDPSTWSLELAARHPYAALVRGDLLRLPFADASLDLVLAMDVVEHLDDDRAAMGEIARVLRPGGKALFTVPAYRWMWGLQDELSHHERRYTRPALLEVIASSGLRPLRATYFNAILLPPIWAGRQVLKILPHRLASEGQITAPLLNAVLRAVFASERWLLRCCDLPFGVSIYCLAQKPR